MSRRVFGARISQTVDAFVARYACTCSVPFGDILSVRLAAQSLDRMTFGSKLYFGSREGPLD